jgi:hypothetical protein
LGVIDGIITLYPAILYVYGSKKVPCGTNEGVAGDVALGREKLEGADVNEFEWIWRRSSAQTKSPSYS